MKLSDEYIHRTMSVKKLSQVYDIPKWTVYSLLYKKEILHYKLGRKILIPVMEFEKYLENHSVKISETDNEHVKQD